MEWSLVTEARDPVEKCPFELKAVVITEPQPVCRQPTVQKQAIKVPAAYLGPRPVPRPCTRDSNPKVTSDPNLSVLPTPQATNPGAAPGNSSTALKGRGFKCSLPKLTLVIIYFLFIECVCVCACTHLWKSSDGSLELVVAPAR